MASRPPVGRARRIADSVTRHVRQGRLLWYKPQRGRKRRRRSSSEPDGYAEPSCWKSGDATSTPCAAAAQFIKTMFSEFCTYCTVTVDSTPTTVK